MKCEILRQEGFAIDKSVDIVVNSANNGLLLGGSGAEKIRDATGYLPKFTPEDEEFYRLCYETGIIGFTCLRWLIDQKDKNQKTNPSYVQLNCLKRIRTNENRPIDIGSAEVTSSGILKDQIGKPQYIIHAVSMGYEFLPGTKGKRIEATEKSIESSVRSALEVASGLGHTLAIPIMGARPGYGMTPEKSYSIIEDLASKCDLSQVIICADNKDTKEFFKSRGYI